MQPRDPFQSFNGFHHLLYGCQTIFPDPFVALPIVVIDPAQLNSIQECMVEVQAVAEMATNAIFGKRMLYIGIDLVIKFIQDFQALLKYSNVLPDE